MRQNTQKKNCNKCKAYRPNNFDDRCRLGYEVVLLSLDDYGFMGHGVPQEPCPKPVTYSDYLWSSSHMRKQRAQAQKEQK